MAGQLAQAHGGDVLALQVVVVPEPVPLDAGRRRAQAGRALLEQALVLAHEANLPVQTMTRVARGVGQGILDTAADEQADLILLGWQGPSRSRSGSLGQIVDAVLRDATCDVLVVRGDGAILPKRILVPTAGGPHARAAARLALLLAQGGGEAVTLLCVQVGPSTSQQVEQDRCRIEETLEGLAPEQPPRQRMVPAASVVEGIVQEAQGHDLVMLGVSEETLLDRIMFGSVPLQVAARVPHTILVQAYRGLTGIWTRRVTRTLLRTLPTLSDEEQAELRHALSQGAQPGIDYFVLIVISCIIASLGLLLDSPAVVIGAMLVAPLMSPILAFSLGLVLGDLRLIRFSAEAILKGVALAGIIAASIGLLSPLKT
ncbi:MAG: universal stress protein, partial [Anaerolineae bacterium]|nr:universal stress protein [Anaerolineae bacterium]